MTDREVLYKLIDSFDVLKVPTEGFRHHLADYLVANGVTVRNQKNTPLTLEELRQMDGEPVWMVTQNGGKWVIASGAYWWDSARNKEYGKTWLAYRHKPEEASK